jgi:hypothetical protein
MLISWHFDISNNSTARMTWTGMEHTSLDDDLKNIFFKLPAGVHLEVLLDSCHSGTGTHEAAALACLPTEYAITRAKLLKCLRASLKHEGYDQIPQLECPAAAKKKKLLE